MKIESFDGVYRFLSNFSPAKVTLDGVVYPTVEHAYQAAKFPPEERAPFQNKDLRPALAKRMGAGKGGEDWHHRSLSIMLDLLREKFRESALRQCLLETGNAELVEGNWWGDTFFGVCEGVGENHLGKMLMQVRDELKKIDKKSAATA